MPRSTFRVERDPLGEVRVPSDAYYGGQTTRAVQNFPISGLTAPEPLVTVTILIKKAAAVANCDLGLLTPRVANAIVKAADEILDGRLRDQFVVDVYQAGAGTSHNMNANEVLANRAGELLGDPLGSYAHVHPNDHVNMGQSTNDVYPTATRLALLFVLRDLLTAARDLTKSSDPSMHAVYRPGHIAIAKQCDEVVGDRATDRVLKIQDPGIRTASADAHHEIARVIVAMDEHARLRERFRDQHIEDLVHCVLIGLVQHQAEMTIAEPLREQAHFPAQEHFIVRRQLRSLGPAIRLDLHESVHRVVVEAIRIAAGIDLHEIRAAAQI